MSSSPLSASAYEVLGVSTDASTDDLRRAYRQRLREAHPDTGGDAAVFIRVQEAWALIGDPDARAAYDRSSGLGAPATSVSVTRDRPASTRPRARSYGQPGGWRRERYLTLAREWAGRGVQLEDPYAAAFVRSAPRELRQMLADALAEEETARIIAPLGMGYTVWHDVATNPTDPEAKIDHIVLGPSGLYGVLSEDYATAVSFRRGEIVADGADRHPVGNLVARVRSISRAARVRFSGVIVVLPDDDVPDAVTTLGAMRGLPVAVASRSGFAHLLRAGIPGARAMGGTELFDVRTRLQHSIRFV